MTREVPESDLNIPCGDSNAYAYCGENNGFKQVNKSKSKSNLQVDTNTVQF